jgi:predicted lysophospholipase L1 biosynthesis ABC-type transport system permease subunit
LGYTSFRFGIIPDFNRDLQEVSANLEQAIRFTPHQWFNQLTANIHDEELRHVVEPMEQTLSLFRLLYPIAVILSIVLGAGLSVLLMLQNAKNAAIMTVLGMPKYKSRLMLWAELMIVCIAGAIIGMVVLAVITLSLGASLLLAALPYIAGTIIGAAIGAILITNRAPLDLLQVKE